MDFCVYIIYSSQLNTYYIGHSQNLEDRLGRHTNQRSKFTKKANDWQLVYQERFLTRAAAMKRESEIKRKKSRIYIESLI